jgi:DNA-binding MarR family transcriptional regulator
MDTPHDPDTGPLLDAMVQSAFGTIAVLSRVAAEHDMSLTQLRVLAILEDRRLRMAELAAFLGLEKSTMSGLVDRAEARGLLARAPGTSDRRVVEVFATDDGRTLAARLRRAAEEGLAPRTAVLTPGEQRTLRALLDRTVAPFTLPD